MKTITETYADYFRDLHGWLAEYFFAKLARACFEKAVKVSRQTSLSLYIYIYWLLEGPFGTVIGRHDD